MSDSFRPISIVDAIQALDRNKTTFQPREVGPAKRVVNIKTGSLIKDIVLGNCSPRVEPKVIPPPTLDTYWRASSIGSLCPVEEVYCALKGLTRYEQNTMDADFRMKNGTFLHEWLIPYIDHLVGTWTCRACGDVRTKWSPTCPKCKSYEAVYQTPKLQNDTEHISGTPDGIGAIGGEGEVVEIKTTRTSIKKFTDGDLFAKYVVQCNVYMWLAGVSRARMFVFNPARLADNEEFILLRDDELVEAQLAKVRAIRTGIETKTVPYDLRDPVCTELSCVVRGDCQIGGTF